MIKLRRPWQKLRLTSLKRAVFVAMALMVAAVFIVMYFYINLLQRSDRQANYNFRQLADSVRGRFEGSLTETIGLAEYATYSNAFQKYLLSDTPGTIIEIKDSAQDVLNFISYSVGDARDIFLYSSKGRKLSVTNYYGPVALAAMESLDIDNAHTFRDLLYSAVIPYKGGKYLVCMMSASGTIQGYRTGDNTIITSIIYDMDHMLDALSLKGYEGSITLLMKDGRILGSTGPTVSEDMQNALSHAGDGRTSIAADGQSWYYCQKQIGSTDWEVTYLVPKNSMLSLQSGSWTFIIILLVMLAISSIMFGLLIDVHRDIRHMVKDLTYHGKETFSIRMPGMKEFCIIADTLMDTLHRLKEANEQKQQLTTASYEALLAQKQAEMQAYRSQINPLFLFNTLETVRSLAHHYQILPLEQLITGMSLMFRYSLYSPTMVTLADELEHLNGYISVINVRFPGRYTIKRDISPDTLNFQVLSMLLQPVVENAVQHAFKGRKRGTVLVQTFLRTDRRLGIRIVDNGIGMRPEAVAEITRKFYEPEDEPDAACTSIGLINIRKRLKLAFGDHAHLSVTSRQGYYTSVELIIPGPDYG